MDLLALYKNPVFNFQRVVHEALRAYVRGQQYFVFVPRCDKNLSDFEFKYIYQFTITLDEDADGDVIDWLESAQPRLQNALIKSVLRGSLVGQSVFACLSEDADRIKSNMLAEQALTCGIKIQPPPTGKHTRSGKSSKSRQAKKHAVNQVTIKPMLKAETVTGHARLQKQAPACRNSSLNDRQVPAMHKTEKEQIITGMKETAGTQDKKPAAGMIQKTAQPEPAPDTVTALPEKTVTNVPDADDFDLTGFDFDESTEKSEAGEFDLFGDISNMLKGF